MWTIGKLTLARYCPGRGGSDDNGIYGLQDQLTVTGPYINVSFLRKRALRYR